MSMSAALRAMTGTELARLIADNAGETDPQIFEYARMCRARYYGDRVYLRGLIEFTNYCKNDCYYCGIRRSNGETRRYRLSADGILSCCRRGYELGFRTFVLQGGEDPYYTDDKICGIISGIKSLYPDCALTLSLGERSRESYRALRDSGADRYLLRHETASEEHYSLLHPPCLSLARRKECLYALKEIGFQTGAGFMVGSPGQTYENLAEDLLFLKDFQPHMVGIGPFIPHRLTPFAAAPAGALNLTLLMVALTRILLPKALLPATTALGTIHPEGREMGLKSGANVVMPNLSPPDVKRDYDIYDNKIRAGDEAEEGLSDLARRINFAGFTPDFSRGDYAG